MALDGFYNASMYIEREEESYKPGWDVPQLGLQLGYQADIGPLKAGFAYGYYLLTTYVPYTRSYHMVMFQYRVAPKVAIFSTLKSHFFRADVIEYGIIYHLSDD